MNLENYYKQRSKRKKNMEIMITTIGYLVIGLMVVVVGFGISAMGFAIIYNLFK